MKALNLVVIAAFCVSLVTACQTLLQGEQFKRGPSSASTDVSLKCVISKKYLDEALLVEPDDSKKQALNDQYYEKLETQFIESQLSVNKETSYYAGTVELFREQKIAGEYDVLKITVDPELTHKKTDLVSRAVKHRAQDQVALTDGHHTLVIGKQVNQSGIYPAELQTKTPFLERKLFDCRVK